MLLSPKWYVYVVEWISCKIGTSLCQAAFHTSSQISIREWDRERNIMESRIIRINRAAQWLRDAYRTITAITAVVLSGAVVAHMSSSPFTKIGPSRVTSIFRITAMTVKASASIGLMKSFTISLLGSCTKEIVFFAQYGDGVVASRQLTYKCAAVDHSVVILWLSATP